MDLVYKRNDCMNLVDFIRSRNETIGFVPTMGALHDGHLSLLNYSLQQTDYTIISIFVNRTQFNDPSDFKNYPREIDADVLKLKEVGCHGVFIPEHHEIYNGTGRKSYDLGNLDKTMEGKQRPGHFQGVAMVVDRLFDIVKPDKAYFGEKDFQQLQIIKYIVKNLNHQVDIIQCPIIREHDGLAMSSRNQLLSQKQRENAPIIYKCLQHVKEYANKGSLSEIKKVVVDEINQTTELQVEYFEIVDEETMQDTKKWEKGKNMRACIAVKAGNIRLIDNVRIS